MGIFDKIKDALDGDKHPEQDTRTEDVPFDPSLDLPREDQPADASVDSAEVPGDQPPQNNAFEPTATDETVVAQDAGTDQQLEQTNVIEPQAEQAAAEPEAAPQPAVVESETYTVVEGDNLTWIGERFGVSVEDLVAANNIENPDLIYPGQVLTIPR